MKIFHGITAADASLGGGGEKFARGDGDSSSPRLRLNSTSTPYVGLFSGQGLSFYSFPMERVKGEISLPEWISPYDPRVRMMRSEFKLILRAGLEVLISAQAAVVLLFLGFVVYIGAMGEASRTGKNSSLLRPISIPWPLNRSRRRG